MFDPVAAMRRYHSTLDAHDVAAVADLLAEHCVYESAGLGQVHGKAAIVTAMARYFEGHPDHQSFDDHIVQTGALAARSHWKLKATHKLTGIVVDRQGTEDIDFDADGKIRRVTVKDET